jgi:hypothetical protein
MAIQVRGEGKLKATKCRIAEMNMPAITFMGQGGAEFTETTFLNNNVVLAALVGGKFDFKSCTFQGNGVENGSGAMMILGRSTQTTADQCTFTGNHCGIMLNNSAGLTLTGGSFKECGYTEAPPNDTTAFGLIGVFDQSHLSITGCTFAKNRQGVAIMNNGTAEMKDCHFTETGVKNAEDSFGFYSNALSISGKGAKLTLTNSTIDQTLRTAINIVDGGSITMEDTQITNTVQDALGVGADDSAPCTVHVKGCKFLAGGVDGISLTAGTVGDITDTESSGNHIGLVVADPGTRVTVVKLTAKENKSAGIWSVNGAEITVTNGAIQKSDRGVQVGLPGDASKKSTLTLEKCLLDENSGVDALVCASSQLNLNNCDFGADAKVKIKKEKGSVVKADPPLPSSQLADNDDTPSSKKESSSSKKGSSTTPRTRRSNPKDAIDHTIDQLSDRLKKIFH